MRVALALLGATCVCGSLALAPDPAAAVCGIGLVCLFVAYRMEVDQ